MAKRLGCSDEENPHAKRRKAGVIEVRKNLVVDIKSPQALQRLLAFEQDEGPQFKQKIQAFKSFLDSIAYGEDTEDKSTSRAILLEYLKSQVPSEGESNSSYLADIVQTWLFSTQSNNEGLFSAVVAVLALLLKTISSFVEFRDYGNLLCTTLLQKEQIRLFDRALSTHKPKEHVISPCLRLLTEIVSFDGGNAAKGIYLHRDVTFKQLDVFLGMRKEFPGGNPDEWKPSVRNNALRYLFANLKMQDRNTKTEILAQGRIFRAVFQDIREDSPIIVQGILDTLKREIVEDKTVPRLSKSRLFTDWTLGRLATLYSYHENDRILAGDTNVEDLVHVFLVLICTHEEYGVLVAQNIPQIDTANDSMDVKEFEDMSLTSESYRKQKPVRNRTLAFFLQGLRPYANVLQNNLTLAVFQVAPELIADYFHKKNTFSFEPKLTATWVGYSLFLMSTVQLPIPRESLQVDTNGSLIHSPPSILLEYILPQPLSQKVLARCLHQSADLITFFAVRILVLAFEKLEATLRTLRSPSREQQDQSKCHGDQAASTLASAFCQRCPHMKHVITTFRKCKRGNVMLREAIARLLTLYYKVIPQMALDEKFDISVALCAALQEQKPEAKGLKGQGMQLLELDHLLDIARRSPDMDWWHKTEHMLLSPFTTVLRIYALSGQTNADNNLKELLQSIIRECAILKPDTRFSSLDVLVLSLEESHSGKVSDTLYGFLDNCVLRFVKKPVKYYDILASLAGDNESSQIESGNIDLLLVVILEQWPFLIKTSTAPDTVGVAMWLAHYLESSISAGGNPALLSQIRDKLSNEAKDNDCRAVLSKALKEPGGFGQLGKFEILAPSCIVKDQASTARGQPKAFAPPEEPLLSRPPDENEDHVGLRKWTQKDVQDAIGEGSVGDLIFCLCSKHEDIRKQAQNGLVAFMAKLEPSGYSEWQQTYVLAGEVVETAKQMPSKTALPYFAGVIAARSFLILANPLHVMYTKINKFLNKGPQWNVVKLPSYWVDRVLLHPPTDDDAHYEEVRWMLDGLIDGLRTPADMENYRRCHILERLLLMSASPSLPKDCHEKLMRLLFRCTYVEGSTTLITRCGLLSWICCQIALRGANEYESDILKLLVSRVYKTSDHDRVKEWSKGAFTVVLDSLQITSESR